MKIRTQFILSIVIFASILIILAVSLIVASVSQSGYSRQLEIVSNVETSVTDLGYISNDYLLYGESQQRTRWTSSLDSISSALSKLGSVSPESQSVVDSLQTNVAKLQSIYNEVSSTIEGNNQTSGYSFNQAFIQVSWSRLEVQNQEAVFDATRLYIMLDNQLNRTRQTINVLLFILVGICAAYIFSNYLLIFSRTLRSISELRAGTGEVGAGNLDCLVPVKRKDEISDLSRAFNRMTADLKTVTASKSDMEKEIAERKKAEAVLKESEAKANALIKYAPTGIYEIDFRGPSFISVNDSMCVLTGYSREELFALGPTALLDEESRKVFAARIKRQLSGEKIDEIVEYKVRKKDGSIIFVTLNVAFSKERQGTALVIGHDVTERRKMEDALKDSEQRWSTTLASIGDAVISTDEKGRVMFMNRVAEALTGWTLVEASNRPVNEVFNIINEKTLSPAENPVARVLLEGAIVGLANQTILVKKDGTQVPIDDSGAPIQGAEGEIKGVVLVFRDITERKKSDQLKDEFIGMVSHEIKTPLTVIIGSLLVATGGNISQGEVNDLLHEAVVYSNELANLTDNLLELSRNQSNRLNLARERSYISEAADEVIKKLKTKSPIHRLVTEIPSDIPDILVDPLRIQRVLYNLVDNAIKYSPNGGEVKVSAHVKDSKLIVGVSDQGLGISPDDQQKLFKHFERIDAYEKYSIPGLGLGLRVCQILVEAHGGNIWLKSEPRKGSTFFFSIPISPK